MIDSHCHPQFPQYDSDRDEVIRRTLEAGTMMICVGTDYEMSQKAIEIANKHEGMWASVGVHPNDNPSDDFDADAYGELLKEKKVVAMGEIGLDYYRTEGEEDQKKQKERFIKQLDLAKKLGKPVILHCRDSKAGSTGRAYPDMIAILKNYPEIKGVVHSYTGSVEESKQFLELGFYLGFNGIITFARQYDEVVRNTLLDRILIETDAPYLTPEPHRGQRNEPLYVKFVAEKIAQLKGLGIEEVKSVTLKNSEELFNLKS